MSPICRVTPPDAQLSVTCCPPVTVMIAFPPAAGPAPPVPLAALAACAAATTLHGSYSTHGLTGLPPPNGLNRLTPHASVPPEPSSGPALLPHQFCVAFTSALAHTP